MKRAALPLILLIALVYYPLPAENSESNPGKESSSESSHDEHDHFHENDEISELIEDELDNYFSVIEREPAADLDGKKLALLSPNYEEIIPENDLNQKSYDPGRIAFANSGKRERKIRRYRVEAGDTIWGIGKKFNIDPQLLIKYNPILKKRPLQIGEQLVVGKQSRKSRRLRAIRHRIRSGDTLSGLALKYKTSVAKLKKWNDLKSDQIAKGKKLIVAYRKRVKPGFVEKKLFIMPARGRITSRYGRRRNPFTRQKGSFHRGIDIALDMGYPFKAVADGVVIKAGRLGGYGNCIFIRHKNNYVSVYAHSKLLKVSVGDEVRQGEIIGEVGRTGNATGPHLHFEIRKRDRAINPMVAMRYKKLVPIKGAQIKETAYGG